MPSKAFFEGGKVRSWKGLYEPLKDYDTWVAALCDASRGKMKQPSVAYFVNHFDDMDLLRNLQAEVLAGKWRGGEGTTRIIYEPKRRELRILPFRDRIVHHALGNALMPYLEKYFIADTYSGMAGRGQHKASKRCSEAVRRNKYVLKCDIHHFYPSIDRERLIDLLQQKIADKRFMALLAEDIRSRGGDGLPIGSMMAVLYGNFYLTPLDMFCKRDLHVKDYMRYCDDFLLFTNNKAQAHEWARQVEALLASWGMTLSCLEVQRAEGVDFVGYRHYSDKVLVRGRTLRRIKKHMNNLRRLEAKGRVTAERARAERASIAGWLKHSSQRKRLQKIIAKGA